MKNSDMPAMPFTKITSKSIYNGQETTETVDGYEGLSKREMFAMHAMQGMLSNQYVSDFNDSDASWNNKLASRAVSYADALLKELDK